MRDYLFSSESVTEGHPDKICDAISDAVVDAALAQDPAARVACEAMVKNDAVWMIGEITTTAVIDYEKTARAVIRDIGYTADCGFCADTCAVTIALDAQSPDIALGVDASLETKSGGNQQLGAGDQGMMFGYACDETPELMPLPIQLSHQLCRTLADVRKTGALPYLRPDGKAQVTVEYLDGKPLRIDAVVLSTQHSDAVSIEQLRADIKSTVLPRVLPAALLDANTKYFINPTGRFVTGGPVGDSGLTGRKIIVDTYGGAARHGGGCFSGKDPTKIDRSGAYVARYIAKNVVAAGLARRCEVQLAYAIGVATPVSVFLETFGTETVAPERIRDAILATFDLRPSGIIEALQLRRPVYRGLAAYGQIGRVDLGCTWEQTDRTDALIKAIG